MGEWLRLGNFKGFVHWKICICKKHRRTGSEIIKCLEDFSKNCDFKLCNVYTRNFPSTQTTSTHSPSGKIIDFSFSAVCDKNGESRDLFMWGKSFSSEFSALTKNFSQRIVVKLVESKDNPESYNYRKLFSLTSFHTKSI